MEPQILLRDPEVTPEDKVLHEIMGDDIFDAYSSFLTEVLKSPFQLSPEWRYYNDGKSWLCKMLSKKKNLFWLSIWEGCFRLTFYFSERHLEELSQLNLSSKAKDEFSMLKPVGKLHPMIISISSKELIPDVLEVVQFKKNLK
jgi:hypothetical protein